MKLRIAFLLLAVFCVASAQNQRPVKKNLMLYFDKVPVPPSTCKEAHDKSFCDPNYAGKCDSDTLFNALVWEIVQLQNQISVPPGTEMGDMVKKMQDPEFQKKMQSMSDEEKMKMAMQMSQAMAPGPMKPEPASVTAAFKAYSDLNQAEAEAVQSFGVAVQEQQKNAQELEEKHKAVDEWKVEEIKKLPELPSTGEMGGGHDPKLEYKVEMNAWKKHLAIMDEELKKTSKAWADMKTKYKKQYQPFETALEKTHYGDDARNNMSKSSLGSGQTLILGAVQRLVDTSKSQYDEGADWYERMLVWQKQHQIED